MGKAEVAYLFSSDPPTREWEEEYFRRFRPNLGGPRGRASLRAFLSDLDQKNLDLLRQRATTPFIHSRLLFLTNVLTRYAALDNDGEEAAFHMIGHLVSSSLTPDEEAQWASASGSDFKRPTLEEVVHLVIRDLSRFYRPALLADLFEFAYFSYRRRLDVLVEESLDDQSWMRNVTEVVPHLHLPKLMPTHIRSRWLPWLLRRHPFLNRERVRAMDQEAKRSEEVFANLYTVGARGLGPDEVTQAGFESIRQEIIEAARRKGQVEAIKLLVYYHRNKLRLPRYLSEEIRVEIERLPDVP